MMSAGFNRVCLAIRIISVLPFNCQFNKIHWPGLIPAPARLPDNYLPAQELVWSSIGNYRYAVARPVKAIFFNAWHLARWITKCISRRDYEQKPSWDQYKNSLIILGKNSTRYYKFRGIGYWSSDAAYRNPVIYIRLYSHGPGCGDIHCRSDYCALHSIFQSPP